MASFVRTQSISHAIGEGGRLALRVTTGDVRVKAAPGGEASVQATFEIAAASDEEADRVFDEIKLHVEAGDGQLTVEEQRDAVSGLGSAIARLFRGRGRIQLKVEAQLPPMAELRLDGVTADVQAEGLRGEQRYATVSGDLYLTDLGGSLRINTVSGDVTLRASEPIDLRVEAVSGDLSAITSRLDGLRASSVSGDIEIEAALGAGEFGVETVSGDLTVGLLGGASFQVRGLSTDIRSDLDHRIEGNRDRRRVTVGAGGPEFSFSSMSGDLAIRRPRRIDAGSQPAKSAAARPRSAEDQLAVLRALEAGDIDVDEAARRLGDKADA